jgi:hypothetical protein
VILLLHDVADPFMEIGKMLLYTGNNTGADISFGIFALGEIRFLKYSIHPD